MQRKRVIAPFLLALAILAVLAGCRPAPPAAAPEHPSPPPAPEPAAPPAPMPAASPGASESPASQPLAFSGAILAGTSAPLLDFRKEDYDAAIQTSKLIVLYFFATWCPSCQAEFPRMQSAFDKLTTNEVIGFRVNYNDGDTDAAERALAKEYGVAYQHTKVLVRNGERLLKAPDVWSEERYALEIKKHLAS